MNKTIKEEKPWIYLVFFLIGIVSFPVGFILGGSFSLIINLEGIWQLLLFPLLTCSVLFAIGLYSFRERSFIFASKAFAISFAASFLIFLIGFFGGQFSGGVGFPPIYPLLLLLILSAIGLIAFKKQPNIYFSLKAFVVSFATIFFIFGSVLGLIPFMSLFLFFGAQQDATTSLSIQFIPLEENMTIYVPVFLDEKRNIMKMYLNPTIKGDVTTAIIDTEYGKAFKISGSGHGRYLFNWNDVPGKDTGLFVKWLEDLGAAQTGEKPGIKKSSDGKTISVSGLNKYELRLEEGKVRISLFDVPGFDEPIAKNENGALNVYSRKIEINMQENHGKLKEGEPGLDEFLKGFTISMSEYTSHENPSRMIAWVYSESEIEKFSFFFERDPHDRINREKLSIRTEGGVHLGKGWQSVKLSEGIMSWD